MILCCFFVLLRVMDPEIVKVGNYEQEKCPDDRASEEWSTGGGKYINRYFA